MEFLGTLAERRVLVIGAGENAELTARALRDRGVQALFRGQPPLRPRAWAGAALRRPGHLVRRPARRAREGRHRRQLHRRTASDRRARGARVRRRVSHGPATRSDRPRRAARHRAERARLPRHRALRHGRPAARGGPQPRRARGRGRRGARAGARGGRALRELARLARRRSHHLGAAPPRRRGRRSGAARERDALGVALGRPIASGSRSWPARWSRGCSTSRRCG